MPKTLYHLEALRYGDNLGLADDQLEGRDRSNLDQWVAFAKDLEYHGGRFSYQVVNDKTGVAEAWIKEPHEGVRVNVLEAGPGPLEDILSDYGVPEEWRIAWCKAYLEAHASKETDDVSRD